MPVQPPKRGNSAMLDPRSFGRAQPGTRAVEMARRLANRVVVALVVTIGGVGVLFMRPGSLAEASLASGSPALAEASIAPAPTSSPSLLAETPVPTPTSLPSPLPSATAVPSSALQPRVLAEINAAPSVGTTYPADSVTEPAVAVSPFDPNLVAVVYQRLTSSSYCGLDTGIRISHDGGRTWQNATGRPWNRTERGPNYHGVIAWGPGPVAGSSRLWWADTTVPHCDYGAHSVSVSYSDNFGKTWSPLYVERRTPPWIGGYPDITVDCNRSSPNFGVVYVVYNWLADVHAGPGLAVLASADGGRSWQTTQVPRVGLSGYPAAWRIDYRVRTAPDGSAYVAFYEADMHVWNTHTPFASGGLLNVGRVGFAVAHLHYNRSTRRLGADPAVWSITLAHNVYTVNGAPASGTVDLLSPDPRWQMGFDVDQSTGRVLLAVSDYSAAVAAGRPHGVVKVGYCDDGAHWQWLTLAALPTDLGLPQSSFKPTLAAHNGVVFVGFHGLTDIAPGASQRATVGTYYAVSYDGGVGFTAPSPVTAVRWYIKGLAADVNGVGLRERADFGPDGIVRFAYGDGRLAATYPGRSAVFVALVDPGLGPTGRPPKVPSRAF